MSLTKACKRCGTVFQCVPSRMSGPLEKKFCSNACAYAAMVYTPEMAIAAFWSRVDKTGTCWLWTGAKRDDGYGRLNIGRKQLTAHRFSWELVNGPLPKGAHVLHSCDTPACVNPAHLRAGTHLENMAEMAARKRARSNAKLTEAQVREIKANPPRIGRGGNVLEYAQRYGVSVGSICGIVRGDHWRHI